MFIKLKLLVVFLLIAADSSAQVSRNDFEKALDYSNCKITYAYLNQYASSLPNGKSDKENFEEIRYEINNCNISNPIGYAALSELLNNNNFSQTNNKISAVINQLKFLYQDSFTTEQAITTIIDGIYDNRKLKNAISNYSDIEKLKEPLENDIIKLFGNSISSIQARDRGQTKVILNDFKGQTKGNEAGTRSTESLGDGNGQNSFSPDWLSIILILITFLGLLFFINFKISELEKRITRHRNAIDALKASSGNNGAIQGQPYQSSAINSFQRNTERSISDLNIAISKLQSEVSSLTMKSQQGQQALSPASIPLTQEKQKTEILYAPIPNKDGSFNASSVQPAENPSSSFYKFTITDANSSKASFEFLNVDRAIKDATSSPELILYPVCKIKNALNQNAKRIKTVTPGEVNRLNEKWILSTKAEIEYE